MSVYLEIYTDISLVALYTLYNNHGLHVSIYIYVIPLFTYTDLCILSASDAHTMIPSPKLKPLHSTYYHKHPQELLLFFRIGTNFDDHKPAPFFFIRSQFLLVKWPCSYGFPTDFRWFSHGFWADELGHHPDELLDTRASLRNTSPAQNGWPWLVGHGRRGKS